MQNGQFKLSHQKQTAGANFKLKKLDWQFGKRPEPYGNRSYAPTTFSRCIFCRPESTAKIECPNFICENNRMGIHNDLQSRVINLCWDEPASKAFSGLGRLQSPADRKHRAQVLLNLCAVLAVLVVVRLSRLPLLDFIVYSVLQILAFLWPPTLPLLISSLTQTPVRPE